MYYLDAPGQFKEDKEDFWFKEVPGFEKKMTKDAAKKQLKKDFQKAKKALMVLCIRLTCLYIPSIFDAG